MKNDEIVNVTCADNGKLQCKGRGDTAVKLPYNTARALSIEKYGMLQ
jgi:hypothetical protein